MSSDEYLDPKHFLCRKRLIDKLILNTLLNTTETLLDNKIVHTKKVVVICLLLAIATFISFYYYYTKDCIKNTCRIIFIQN